MTKHHKTQQANDSMVVVTAENENRAVYVRKRLADINHSAGSLILENGALLLEMKENAYYKEFGFKTFDECITAMQGTGEIDYSYRQARNFMAITTMFYELHLGEGDLAKLTISRAREIATLPISKEAKRNFIEEAKDMSVFDVQQKAKKMRSKAFGNDKDPIIMLSIAMTESQRAFVQECLDNARQRYSLSDASDAFVLCDAILAEWSSGLS